MKKSLIFLSIAALILVSSVSVYAYYGQRSYYGGRGGGRMATPQGAVNSQAGAAYGQRSGQWNATPQGAVAPQSGAMHGGRGGKWAVTPQGQAVPQPGAMYGGRGGMMGGRWNANPGTQAPGQATRPQWNAPAQILTETQISEIAQQYITDKLSGYTLTTVEKDAWRPLYIVTVSGADNAVTKLWIHGFDGQIMHVIPESAN